MTKLFRTPDGKSVAFTFILVSSLFLLWGFCNGMIDVMDKHFQDKLHLTKAQSAWVQFAHYMGYFLMALPAGWVARRLGYKGGIIAGLLLVAVGGFWFYPANGIGQFWAFLLGVCVLSMGLTFLETIANPYTTVLGSPDGAAVRINLAQSCNGIGWILGPQVGAAFFYGMGSAAEEKIYIPYVGVGIVVLFLALAFFFAPLPDLKSEDTYHLEEDDGKPKASIWSRPHFSMAVLSQFLYVAAQAGIFSFFINYMVEEVPAISAEFSQSFLLNGGVAQKEGQWFITEAGAAHLMSYAFGLFLIGRFTGAGLLRAFAPHRVLGTYALVNVGVMALIVAELGTVSTVAIFASFFFMSIMFPTIFALGIHGLGTQAKKAASFIVMAIVGGALLPKLMGLMGDHFGMAKGFAVPMLCFAFIAYYGFNWARLSGAGQASVNLAKGH